MVSVSLIFSGSIGYRKLIFASIVMGSVRQYSTIIIGVKNAMEGIESMDISKLMDSKYFSNFSVSYFS